MVIVGGIPGAGKGYAMATVGPEALGFDPKQFAEANPDRFKMGLARYANTYEGLADGEISPLTHEESSHLAKVYADSLYAEGKNVLWDITIDGRLHQRGWLPPATREKHFASFKRAFQGSDEKLAKTFAHFFDQNSHTHRELVEFAQHPEKRLAGETVEASSKGRCAICHFPTFQLLNPSVLSADLIAKIQEHFPMWNTSQFICQQCVDLFEARLA